MSLKELTLVIGVYKLKFYNLQEFILFFQKFLKRNFRHSHLQPPVYLSLNVLIKKKNVLTKTNKTKSISKSIYIMATDFMARLL